jgi:hypothetical protein
LIQFPAPFPVPGVNTLLNVLVVEQLPTLMVPTALAPGYESPPAHMSVPGVVLSGFDGISQHKTNPGRILAAVDLNDASRALILAELKLTKTIEARIPMMAITIKSSMRVKPLRRCPELPSLMTLFIPSDVNLSPKASLQTFL